jgi:peptidoglycan/LPS O-acetylase OafA/YrhL
MKISPANTERFRTLDFLRGVAILGVISVHAALTFPTPGNQLNFVLSYGMYGVQLFYLISAITMCLMWEQRAGERSPVKKFYIRRFLRIAPLFWLAIPIYLSVNGFGPSYWAPNGIGMMQIVLTALFLHGLWPDAINSVVPGGWSIAVEMTFYLIFPFLILKFKSKASLYLYMAFFIWALNTLYLKDWITYFFSDAQLNLNPTIIKDYLNLYFINQAPVFLLGCWLFFHIIKKFGPLT